MYSLRPVIDRINEMEKLFDHLRERWRTDPERFHRDEQIKRQLQRVLEYYQGDQWQADYRMDEQGLLPPGLKRGILSEDGFYLFISEVEEWNEGREEPDMKVCDISQEVFGCSVCPGNPTPIQQVMRSMEQGDGSNRTGPAALER